LFGRAAELARLRPWLAEAVGGLPRVVVCSGKEGIGKTRLLEAFSDAAESVGRRCSGRGRWRLASTPPYWLWEQLFGPRRGRILAAAVVRLAQIRKGRRRCPICCPERDYRPSVR
jgi:hypothetical protein